MSDEKDNGERAIVTTIGSVISVRNETHDVKTFRLNLDKEIKFIPGQYCLVSFVDDTKFGGQERPFTFSSTPEGNNRIVEITVKRMGEFTTALHSLSENAQLRLKGPLGETLNFDESVEEDIVFLAGGSGITPFISALRYANMRNLPNRMSLLYGNMTKEDIIYREELRELGSKEKFTVVNTIAKDVPEDWSEETGFINRDMIERYVTQPRYRLWYVCGPPPMMRAMEEILEAMNISKDMWRLEKWEIPGKSK
jgi:NAD(P)H-flavin reductase